MILLVLLACPTLQDVGMLTEKLRSDAVEERDEAARKLKTLGAAALPALKELSKSADADLASRAREIVDAIETALAAQAFRKMEDVLQTAKTVTLSVDVTWRKKNGRFSESRFQGTGTILLKEGGKTRLSIKGTVESSTKGKENPRREKESWIVCDGTLAEGDYIALNGESSGGTRGPAAGKTFFCTLLARGGVGAYTQGWMFNAEPDLDKIARMSELRLEETGKGERVLSYTLEIAGVGSPLSVKAWLSEDGRRVLKRTMTSKDGGDEREITETYAGLEIDADIPDETFKRPDAKK